MKRYLLDTSPLVALIKGRVGAERLMRPWISAQEAATSILTYGEAIEHFRMQPEYARNAAGLRTLLRVVTPLALAVLPGRLAAPSRGAQSTHERAIVGS